MEDTDFNKHMEVKINEFRKPIIEADEYARIELIFLKNFKPTLIAFLENSQEEKVYFTRNMMTSEICDYDLRYYMDNVLGVDVRRKGYKYVEEESTPDKLVFQGIN